MKKHHLLTMAIAISLGSGACQSLMPLTEGNKFDNLGESASSGGLGVQFNFGDQLTAADILSTEPASSDFAVKHAGSDHLHYADVASATVTVTSPFVERPAVITLTRTEILDGWYYVFEKIPPGAAAISLEVKNKAGQKIFSAHKEVEVVTGNMTPVDFTLEFQNDTSCGDAPSCAGSGTGSIKVTVSAVTNCVACLKFTPLLPKAGSPVAISLSQLQGSVDKFTLDTGDGTGKKEVKSWPYSHTYKDPKRYPVSLTLEGKGCKNPYIAKAYVSVLDAGPAAPQPAPADSSPGPARQILFDSRRDGNYEIYAMNPDGSGQTRLTNHSASDRDPSWSPDGSRIAFDSSRDGNDEIYVMKADGSSPTRLTSNTFGDLNPSWSPDGSKLVFYSRRDGNEEIYVMKADGSGQTRLTSNTARDWFPRWSPDGSKIAFSSNRDGNQEIYVMNADGSGQTRLTSNTTFEDNPVWSPDGSKIAFQSTRDGNREIYVMQADGTQPVRLTNHPGVDYFAAWSPDGRQLVFETDRDSLGVYEGYEVYRMNADGSSQTRLTSNTAYDGRVNWGGPAALLPAPTPASAPGPSPGTSGGGPILFHSSRTEANVNHFELFTMNEDGTSVTQVTEFPDQTKVGLKGGRMSPDGTRIVYENYIYGSTDRELFVMNADGTNVKNVTNHPFSDKYPSWTADNRILFHSYGRGSWSGSVGLYLMNADGSNLTQVAQPASPLPGEVDISPDGTKLVGIQTIAASNSPNNQVPNATIALVTMNLDGTHIRQITGTEPGREDMNPRWSPDGQKIVYESWIPRPPDNFSYITEIYTINADGTNRARLTFTGEQNGGGNHHPRWTTTGKILFSSTAEKGTNGFLSDVFVMNADGSNLKNLTNHPARDF